MTAVERKVVHLRLQGARRRRRRRRRGRSRIGTSSSSLPTDWLAAVLADAGTDGAPRPGRGARDAARRCAARRVAGASGSTAPIVDVGSGGGSPGIPLAAALPAREVTLLEAERRKCDFLERWAPPNARVVWGRAEEQETDAYGVALGEGARAAAGRGGVVPRRSCGPAARRSSGSARRADLDARRARVGAARRRPAGGARRARRPAEARADAARIPAPHRRREEATARVEGHPRRRAGRYPTHDQNPSLRRPRLCLVARAGGARRRPEARL